MRRYAGFWIRGVARIIDAILLNVALLAVRIPLGLNAMGSRSTLASEPLGIAGVALLGSLISFAAIVCYEGVFIAWRGATVGKMIFGLKVIRTDGSKVPLGLSFGRYFAQLLSSITLGIGYIMAGFDDEKRALQRQDMRHACHLFEIAFG